MLSARQDHRSASAIERSHYDVDPSPYVPGDASPDPGFSAPGGSDTGGQPHDNAYHANQYQYMHDAWSIKRVLDYFTGKP
jgi:hypothetical protein